MRFRPISALLRRVSGLLVLIGSLAVVSPANAVVNLVTNGDFEQTAFQYAGISQQWNNSTGSVVTGWTNAATGNNTGYGYNVLMMPGQADSSGFYLINGDHRYLWGPDTGVNNGLTDTSPTGGNFIASDGDPNYSGGISQQINNLKVGQVYQLTFNWATAQWTGNYGATKESWQVTFGNSTQSTVTRNTVSQGFDAWTQASMMFTATSTSQKLVFLAQGSPSGVPPTVLLDSVVLGSVPEAETWAMMIVGLGVVGATMRRKRNVAVA